MKWFKSLAVKSPLTPILLDLGFWMPITQDPHVCDQPVCVALF